MLKRTEEKGIKAVIEMCEELGLSKRETISRITEKFDLSAESSSNYINKYWKG